jgi:hypothetical protein
MGLPNAPLEFQAEVPKFVCTTCSGNNDGHVVGFPAKGKFQIEIDKKNKVWMYSLTCGHVIQNAMPYVETLDTFLDNHKSLDGKSAFEFQKQGVVCHMQSECAV